MDFCNDAYFEKVGNLQKKIHEREKKRLELERDLFAYCRSDSRVAQLKCAKLRRHLEEACAREQHARARNCELLKNVDSMLSQAERYKADCSTLHQIKMECWNKLNIFRDKKWKEPQRDKGSSLNGPPEHNSSPNFAKGLYQPSVIFAARQTARDLAADPSTSVLSLQLSDLAPNHCLRSSLQSALLKGAKVSKGDAGASLSDDILNSNRFPDDILLSDKHQKGAPGVTSDCGSAARASTPLGSDRLPSPHVTLAGAELLLPSLLSETTIHSLSPYSKNDLRVSSSQLHPREASQLSSPYSTVVEGTFLDEVEAKSPSVPNSSVEVSKEPSASTDMDNSVMDQEPQKTKVREADAKTVSTNSIIIPSAFMTTEEPHNSDGDFSDSVSEESALGRDTMLPLESFFQLLDHIEGRVRAGSGRQPYRVSRVSKKKHRDVMSLCQGKAGLNGVELEACEAVAAEQLQRLSWSTSKGCLLPWELVRGNSASAEPEKIRSCVPHDGVALWDRWLQHVFCLREENVLSTEEIIQVFTSLLVERAASYTEKAEELLNNLLNTLPLASPTEDSEESSSCGLPSLLNDSGEIKPARPISRNSHSAGSQVQSGEEDSADQSPVESIPIRDTKAYHLLKQSATLEGQWRSKSRDEEDDEDDIVEGPDLSGSLNTKNAGKSLHVRGPAVKDFASRRNKTKADALSAVQSKAFWGESDDSSSDIEIALRPQSWNPTSDDDFYD
ncbi:centrosomal protein kizuna isoform X2 [Denticeps clupeoides]|uniref:centrosomal protein kizuna isoform X2 n=1 Tax=Denticeps clupeoides TaxID=299321 RepID=UPI0010A3136E|nr:centrosomal protein kizuna isoform X2 [Denticeps clupeoides]